MIWLFWIVRALSTGETALRIKNTFLEYDIPARDISLRRVKSDSYIMPSKSPVTVQLKPIKKEDIDSNLLELALTQAKAESTSKMDFDTNAMICFYNKLSQRYLMTCDVLKKEIRVLKDAVKRWNKIEGNENKRTELSNRLHESSLILDEYNKGTNALIKDNADLSEKILRYVSNASSTDDRFDDVCLKQIEVLKTREEVDRLEDERMLILMQFKDINGATEMFLKEAFEFYQHLAKIYDKGSKLLLLRQGILIDSLKEWKTANTERREWLYARNIKLSRADFLAEIPAYMIEQEHLCASIVWYVEKCKKIGKYDGGLMEEKQKYVAAKEQFDNISFRVKDLDEKLSEIRKACVL